MLVKWAGRHNAKSAVIFLVSIKGWRYLHSNLITEILSFVAPFRKLDPSAFRRVKEAAIRVCLDAECEDEVADGDSVAVFGNGVGQVGCSDHLHRLE